jgi:hypothetical protein
LLKKTVEQRTREVLEEATKQTEAEQAQRLQSEPIQSSPLQMQRENSQIPSTPRRARMSSSTESTPTQARGTSSPYSSPQEASYASLARSIAVAAAAAAAVANNPSAGPPTSGIPMLGHNPFFSSPMMNRSQSTFSECSVADSLSVSPSYPGTPFEYPRPTHPLGETHLPSNDPSNIDIAQQFPDFAAAVDANVLMRPATLLHPRLAQMASTEAPLRGGRPALTRINSCPADFVDAFGSVQLATPVVERPTITLASVAEQQTKRKRPRISPLGIGMSRSKSSMGVCQTSTAAYFPADIRRVSIPQASPTLAQVAGSAPTSPVDKNAPVKFNFKKESPEKFNNAFLSVEMPPTPISPSGLAGANINAFNESPTLSLARAAGLTQLRKPQLALNTEDIFSPPATPAHSLQMHRGYSFASIDESYDPYSYQYDDQLASSPSQFYIPEAMGSTTYANTMDDMFAMSYDSQPMDTELDYSTYLEV